MSRSVVATSLALAVLAVAYGASGAIVVPVPDYEGDYTTNPREYTRHTAQISYEPPESISAVYFRLAGSAVPCSGLCEGTERTIGVDFLLTIDGPETGTWFIAFEIYTWYDEDFDITVPVTQFPMPDELEQVFLSGEFEMDCSSTMGFVICTCTPYPTATVETATLIINGDPSLESDSTSWGSVRALYQGAK